jgi:L-ascorbate metabolism protein UlaG (beta-lactamase superfamily)
MGSSWWRWRQDTRCLLLESNVKRRCSLTFDQAVSDHAPLAFQITGEGTSDPRFPKHFDGKRFYNPDASQAHGLLDALRWKLTSWPELSPSFISDVEQSIPPRRVEGSGLRTTLVNHSTVLLQQRGSNILTDPIWSERASPLAWIGPRRRRQPGVSWENLPCIDAVLISHNHYDHLDLTTLRRLAARGVSKFIVPAHGARLLRSENIGPAHELDWGESLSLPGFTIHCAPALHSSSRAIYDRNKALWCGYVIECQERLVYFAGDTAFGPHFAQIREKFGSPRLAFLPIGAYEPRWFMSPVHMAPDEAVRAHQILAAKTSIAIHHGTFQLADEGLDTPKKRLSECAPGDSFLVLDNGQFADIP